MAVTEFSSAIKQVASERGIPVESVLESIRTALATAYRKDYGGDITQIEVVLDENTGEAKIMRDGEDVTPSGFGRIAAQTAKQVILQKIRETEKEVVLDEYKEKIGTLVTGQIFRVEGSVIIMDLGKAQGILPQSEQVHSEQYRPNQKLKVLVKDVRDGSRGTEIILSRADSDFVKKLFENEVPEIAAGTVRIDAIAREAGSRTKMAVSSTDEKIDPVGSCVGQKGVRVQSIISELFGEKIDIIPFASSTEKFIASSLSPAKVIDVELFSDDKRAVVTVPEDQQSLAIGKEGQNARLANKLTKWKIDIKSVAGMYSTEMGAASADNTEFTKGNVVGVWDAEIKKVADEKAETVEEPQPIEAEEEPQPAETTEEPIEEATAETAMDEAVTEDTTEKDSNDSEEKSDQSSE
jgi:N utilization substance protein A